MSRTALQLTYQERQAYQPAKAIERRKRSGAKHIQERKQRAWQIARQAGHILREQFHAKKVVVFGSLVHEAWFTPWSDVDLAAWDIPVDRFFAAVAAITELSEEIEMNLVDPETCCPILRTVIERDGVTV